MLRVMLVIIAFVSYFNMNAHEMTKSHADTLLSIYVAELAEKNSVEEVVNYSFVQMSDLTIFYANVNVKSNVNNKLEPREITIKYYKKDEMNNQYNLSLIDASSVSYMCGHGNECSNKCKFIEGKNESSYSCHCLGNEKQNSSCSIYKIEKDNLWDEAKYIEGKSILANIKKSEYAGILNSIPD